MTILEMVKDNKQVVFVLYRDSNLWYKTEDGFLFPVSIEDIGNATFLAQDKAILFMRYIKKHLNEISHGNISLSEENKNE